MSSVLKANLATDVTIAVIASFGDLLIWVAIGRLLRPAELHLSWPYASGMMR